MSSETQHPGGCSEQYAELCALFTTGDLSFDESTELHEHLAQCEACAILLREYASLARVGMAKLAPEFEQAIQSFPLPRMKEAEHRLMEAIHVTESEERRALHSPIFMPISSSRWLRNDRIRPFLGMAATLLLCIGGAFELGRKANHPVVHAPAIAISEPAFQKPASLQSASLQGDTGVTELRQRLSKAENSLSEITGRSSESEKKISDLTNAKEALLAQLQDIKAANDAASTSLAAMTQQRDGLQQQLADTSNSLERVKQDLDQVRQDRQGAVLRVASLENDLNRLNAALAVTNKSASTNEAFLAQDRDVRELMGARQLYIADVFDVQNDGQKSKSYGRVFYTQGRSLLFYAFDLEAQPGYHEAKAFQAWGKLDSSSEKPISLGIFYMDSQSNRRWILKSDNPDVLAQINAVFVTVEPKGGSPKPTGKPFLEAYLHSLPPNHP